MYYDSPGCVKKLCFRRQDSTVWWLVLALQRDWQWGLNLPSRWLSHPPSCESLLHAIMSSFTGTWKKIWNYGVLNCHACSFYQEGMQAIKQFMINSRSTIDPLFSLGPCWLNILAKSRKPDRKVWGLKMGEFRWTGTAYILLRASYFLTSCWTEDLFRSNFHSFAFTPEAWSLWLFF